MIRAQRLPHELTSGAFRVDEGQAVGVSRSRLRASDLSSPHHGVRIHRPPSTDLLERVDAFLPLLHADELFSHMTAAMLLGMRTPRRLRDAGLHVTTIGNRRARRRPGVVGHRAHHRPAAITELGHPATDPIATWLDLASTLTLEETIAMGDGLVRRKRPFTTMDALAERVEFATGVRGISTVRAAMPHIRPGTDSVRETLLRLVLLAAGLREPEVNGEIWDAAGTVWTHGDLVWRAERVIVEYDGEHHRTDRRQFSIDIDRIGRLQAAGWHVIRVDAGLFARRTDLVARIRSALMTPR